MKKHRVVIVGAGRIFKKHIDYIKSKQNKFFELLAIIEKRLVNTKLYFNTMCLFYNLIKRLLINLTLKLSLFSQKVEITQALPNFFKNKKNTIIEKPISVKLKDAEKLVELEKKFKKNVFVVKQNRFNLPIIKLKTAIEKGMFGKIFLATTRVRWRRDQNYYDQAPWRGTYKNDGGVLCNQAIHHIDLLQWLVGEVKSVYAKK